MEGFNTTLIIRIFQGIGSSASETVTPAVVGDLFFVHERGTWMVRPSLQYRIRPLLTHLRPTGFLYGFSGQWVRCRRHSGRLHCYSAWLVQGLLGWCCPHRVGICVCCVSGPRDDLRPGRTLPPNTGKPPAALTLQSTKTSSNPESWNPSVDAVNHSGEVQMASGYGSWYDLVSNIIIGRSHFLQLGYSRTNVQVRAILASFQEIQHPAPALHLCAVAKVWNLQREYLVPF
jgi:hypothetical protein